MVSQKECLYSNKRIISSAMLLNCNLTLYDFSVGMSVACQGFLGASMPMLLTITGVDRPGITSGLTHILATNNIVLLDVEQVVVRGQLTLCMVVDLDSDNDILKDLLFAAKSFGQELDFRVLDNAEEAARGLTSRRYVVTLLGSPVSAQAMHVLSHILAGYSANIDWIRRLSENELSSLEVFITLPDADRFADSLKQQLMSALSESGIDVALQRETLTRRSKRLVVFDMDSTLIPIEVIDEMAKLHGVSEAVSRITNEAMHGRFDFAESLRQRVFMLKGLSLSRIVELTNNIPLNNGAENLMRVLKGLGYKIGIISGGFDIAADHLRERLNLDFAFANKLEINEGVLTGFVHTPIVDAPMKAQLLMSIANREKIPLEQTIAIGDGANDALMLAKAGLGIAFHAKPQLKKLAATSVSSGGLEGILYLLGMSARDVEDFLKITNM